MKFLIMLSLVFCSFAQAKIVTIQHIDKGRVPKEADHAYFSDGSVGILGRSSNKKSSEALEAMRLDRAVDVTMDKDHRVTSIRILDKQPIIQDVQENYDSPINEYEPSVLSDLSAVNDVFKRMNRRWQRDSQCYNRAHVWNYEEFNATGLKSKKVYIFYTRRYIRDYNFKWWFHAIPTVLAYDNGTVVERFLDPMFAKSPLPRKSWTDLFIKSKRNCPVITKYSEYSQNQETEHCYLHFSSMFFWQPRDLETLERTGFEKTFFIRSEINHAYWEAF